MPHIIHRSRWKSPPPPGRRVQLNHPLAHRLWSAAYFSNHYAHDAFKGLAPLSINTGTSDYKSRVYKGGRYRTIYKVTGGTPYWYNRGRVGLSASSSITLMALMGGDGRSTFRSLRCQLSTGVAGSPYPGLYEGDGTNNVWSAGFLGAGASTVSVHGTSPAGQNDSGRVVTAVYRNGTGLELWVDGVQEGFTSSTLNLNGAPAFWQATGAATILEFPAIMLAWDRPLTGGEIAALSENPFQVLRAYRSPSFFFLSGGGDIDLSVANLAHAHPVDGITLTQEHALAVGDAAHAHVVDSITLTQAHGLSLQDALHGHAAESMTLTEQTALAPADALHGHAADGLALTQQHALALADAVHAHTSEQPTLSTAGDLVIAEALQVHAADGITLTQAHALAVADTLHGHAADAITLGGAGGLEIDDALQAHLAESLALTQAHFLIISDAVHQHLADQLALALPGTLVTDSDRVLVMKYEGRTLVLLRASRVLSVAPAARSLSVH